VDFNLHLPANAALFLMMATLATSQIERSNGARKSAKGRHDYKGNR
jgi:hypothetical protein